MILANETYPIESVFNTLRKDAFFWSRDTHYPDIFNSSSDIQYINGATQEPLCQQYMLPYTTLVMAINQTVTTE